jgi:hypothetical protein
MIQVHYDHGSHHHVPTSNSGWPVLQIVISFYQIIASIPIQYEISWGYDVLNQMTFAAVSSVNFFQFESLSCTLLHYSYSQKILIMGLTVPAVMLLLLVPFLLVKAGVIRTSQPDKVSRATWAHFLFSTTFWLFLVYPSVGCPVPLLPFNMHAQPPHLHIAIGIIFSYLPTYCNCPDLVQKACMLSHSRWKACKPQFPRASFRV